MRPRFLSLILPLVALPSLAGCGARSEAPTEPPPPSALALRAIADEPGAPREPLARAIDALFDEEAVGQTRALLVLHGGRIAAERHADGFDSDSRFLGWSMSQCLTGIMIGLLVSDGRLRLDETAPVPAWQRSGDARGEITLRQLLQMRSGLRHREGAAPPHDADLADMLFLSGRDDMAVYAEAQPLENEPGARFEYSAASSVILADLAARALTSSRKPEVRRAVLHTYLRTRLLEPAGMDGLIPEYDAAGTFIGSTMVHGTARDWGRLAEFLRHQGSVGGAQVIPRRWIEFMRRPSPRNPGYGAHLWLNAPQSRGDEVLFPGKAPEDLFACVGEHGQYAIGSPAQKLTVVRLGHSEPEQRAALRARLSDLVALYPVR